ncbi:hypothetical protein CEQ90_15190 [Lewinellaceae bacterium SD302]|nr:hypothetical protein CEQ90_15190 [Lewinellaceae bacterium SD302]
MFRYLLLTLIVLYSGCASAAQSNPRQRAQEYFDEAFPMAELAEWSERERGYVVSFYDLSSNRSVEMTFDRRGRWREVTLSMETDQLRDNITQYLEESFVDYYATAYELRRRRGERRIGLVIDTPEVIYTLLFNTDGELIERYEEGIDG